MSTVHGRSLPPLQVPRRPYVLRMLCLSAFWLLGCNSGAPLGPESKEGQATRPTALTVTGGEVVVGFAQGTLRVDTEVATFRITKFPITRAEYAECVGALRCEPAQCVEATDEDGTNEGSAQPVDCVSSDAAARFCAFHGGKLPSLPQWLSAARGQQVARFAWGNASPTCELHPWAGGSLGARTGIPEAQLGKGAPKCSIGPDELKVGVHLKGAAPSGMEDVLLTPGEMVLPDPTLALGGCNSATDTCAIYGLEGGAIDAATPAAASQDQVVVATSFRCVWEG